MLLNQNEPIKNSIAAVMLRVAAVACDVRIIYLPTSGKLMSASVEAAVELSHPLNIP